MIHAPGGYRPKQKYSTEAPFYPFDQTALVASMRSYEEYSQDAYTDLSAVNNKLLAYLSAPSPATIDIVSNLVTISQVNPQVGPWSAEVVSARTVANAGNLPNPSGLDNTNVNRFA